MLCHLGRRHGVVAKGHRGRGGGNAAGPPACRQTTLQPKEAAAEPAIAGPNTGSAPAEPATGSPQDSRDTQALWEFPQSREL